MSSTQRSAAAAQSASAADARVAALASRHSLTWQVSPDLLGALNAKGYFETCNPAWMTILGWTESEVARMSIFDLLHPDDVERTRAGFNLTQQGQPAIQFPNRYRRKDGTYRWISWVGVPEDGMVYCSGRDITAEVEQAKELAAARRERDSAWAVSQDLLVVVALDGKFLSVNLAWTRLLGWDVSELVGLEFEQITHPDDVATTREVFQGIFEAPLSTPYEYRLRRKDGSYRWFAWTAALSNGAVYGSGRDITAAREKEAALRAAEDALRQSQKMEAVGQLTGGLAHDFNNILAGISGNLELIQMRLAEGRVADVGRYADAAAGAAKRAAALTHRLLAFSRRQTLAPKTLNPLDLVAGMKDLLSRAVGPEIALEIRSSPDLWNAQADPGQLENALLNLCINSRDAMPDGGRIVVESDNRSVDETEARELGIEPGDYVRICVIDDGVGMEPEVAARAFDPFFTTKPIGSGTGLGLSMIYGFARQSGGQARIKSEPGAGSTVTIYLPRSVAEADRADDREISGARSKAAERGTSILVVDDEPTVREVVVEVLGDLGYAAFSANDGASAMERLRRDDSLDLLVTDVGLPGGMNGRQLADAARAGRPGLKVLFITGYAENVALGGVSLEEGMHILPKPFDLETLGRRVKQIIDG